MLTGARPSEPQRTQLDKINDDYIFIDGTKTKAAKRWVKISPKFSKILKSKPLSFFQYDAAQYRESFQNFLKDIGINKDFDLYTMRHTFATNLFYLGVPDKIRSNFLGHSRTEITNDVYTSLDPTITKADLIAIYGDFYPEF